jgi:hypothetical protein
LLLNYDKWYITSDTEPACGLKYLSSVNTVFTSFVLKTKLVNICTVVRVVASLYYALSSVIIITILKTMHSTEFPGEVV